MNFHSFCLPTEVNSCDSCYQGPQWRVVTCIDFDSRIAFIAEQTFVVWLKAMDFVTKNDAVEVGNNVSHSENVSQAMVSNPFM